MLRCAHAWRPFAAALLLCAFAAQAQSFGDTGRKFPATALRGTMAFGAAASATLNGQAVQLAPGARVFDADNRLLLLGDVRGQQVVVHYTLDLYQQPLTVWILTDAERRKQPWPKTLAEAQAWQFDELTQTWSRP